MTIIVSFINSTLNIEIRQTTVNTVMKLKTMIQELYGINWQSALNSLRYFHVCDGSLIPDIMHDILKGELQYEVKLMLQYMKIISHFICLTQS